jgi:hypothetical protein
MILRQQTKPSPAQDLPTNDNRMVTGQMGDCVSVIVLWSLAGGSYPNVRGYHGSGGFDSIDLPSLFHGVPDNANTRIIGCFSPLALASNDRARFTAHCAASFPLAQCVVATGGSNFEVDRAGNWAVV